MMWLAAGRRDIGGLLVPHIQSAEPFEPRAPRREARHAHAHAHAHARHARYLAPLQYGSVRLHFDGADHRAGHQPLVLGIDEAIAFASLRHEPFAVAHADVAVAVDDKAGSLKVPGRDGDAGPASTQQRPESLMAQMELHV